MDKQEDRNQVELVEGSVRPNLTSKLNCTSSVEHGMTLV